MQSREIRLKRYPDGMPTPADFELVEIALPEPGPGQVAVRNRFLSVDPYMRGRMTPGRKSYVPPFELGRALSGDAVGRVVASRDDRFPVGSEVKSYNGWREGFVADGKHLERIEPDGLPPSAFLGILGMPGLTAYGGLLRHGEPKPGETLFVSGAAGAVGSAVAQIGKLKGCRVVGSAGTPEKARWLTDVAGADVAIDYRATEDLAGALARACPDGIQIYFENVGGRHLEAALDNMALHGRIVVCGLIDGYNRAKPGPANLFQIIAKRLTVKGMLVTDHEDMKPAFLADMKGWIASGRVKWQETVVDGIERMPEAFVGLFTGANLGKMVVRVE
jgi:NADPH-dependent curcumin reductase CurA